MGKRKSRAKPPPKKRMDKLDTVFSCPFCNHGTSVECRMSVLSYFFFSFCSLADLSVLMHGIILELCCDTVLSILVTLELCFVSVT